MKHARRVQREGGEGLQGESLQRRTSFTVNGTVDSGSVETIEIKDLTEHSPVIFVDSNNSQGAVEHHLVNRAPKLGHSIYGGL